MPALSGRNARVGVGVALGLFVLCTALTAAGGLNGLDHDVASAARRTTGHATDVALSLIAVTASVPISLAWLTLLVGATQLARRGRRQALTLAAGVVAGSVVEVLLKMRLDHPGPHGVSRSVIALGVEEVGRGSFPSGHMLRGTALALGTALVLSGSRRSRTVLLITVAYVVELACSRVYLNEHWVSDVIGGVLLGVVAALAVAAVPRLQGSPRV